IECSRGDSARVQRKRDRCPRYEGDLLREYLEAVPRDLALFHYAAAGYDVFLTEVRNDLLDLSRDGFLRNRDLDNPLGVSKKDEANPAERPHVMHPATKVDFLPDHAFELVR